MGGEDGEPGHEGQSEGVRVLGSCRVQQRCCGDYSIVLIETCQVLGIFAASDGVLEFGCKGQLISGKHSAIYKSRRRG